MSRAVIGVAVCILLACGNPTSAQPSTPTMTVPPDAALLVAQAQADAATRTGTAATSWTVVEVRPVDWPDGSLGCPQKGMSYIQVITPGYLIKLEFAGRILEYHASRTRAAYCSG